MKDFFIITTFIIIAIGEIEGKRNSSSDSKDDQPFKVHIRLKGSSLGYAGRVEISKDGEVWGTICDKAWSLRDARVICRQLNFPSTEAAVPMAGFGAGSGPIFLKDLKCGGSEQTLLKCKHGGWQTHNESCDHSMDAGVLCRPHKEDFQRILFIVVTSLLVFSYLVNIWFIYFVCCKQKRRRKRHLTAVQQKALTRKKLSQGLVNLGIDCEQCVDNTPVKQDSPVLQRNGVHPGHTERVSRVDGPTGVAANHQEQQPHIYQRLESCLFDPSSREYLEIIEPLTQKAANQQPEMCTSSEKSSGDAEYQSHSPQAPERKIEFSKDSENQYEKLLLRNMSSDNEHASSIKQEQIEKGPSTTNDIPDYVEVIGDDNLAGIAVTTPKSPGACGNANVKRYETLKLGPGSSHSVQGDNASSCLTEDQKSVRAEQEEDDYVELLPENEAGGKESKMAASAPADNESEYEPMNN